MAQLISFEYSGDHAVNVNYQEPENKGGRSALHYAVTVDNRQLVNLLIKNYADVLVKDSEGRTPMHLVCQESGNIDIFTMLLDSCYDAKDSLDTKKKTPMDYAEKAGFTNIIEYCKSVTHVLFSRDF